MKYQIKQNPKNLNLKKLSHVSLTMNDAPCMKRRRKKECMVNDLCQFYNLMKIKIGKRQMIFIEDTKWMKKTRKKYFTLIYKN